MKIIKELIPYVIIVIVVVFIRTFIVTPAMVDGASMEPTLEDRDVLLINKYDDSIDRFDIVVFNYEGERLIKRVIGLPGDHIKYQNNKLYVNGKLVKENFKHDDTEDFDLASLGYNEVKDGYYFVVGDNRGISKDSRIIGLVSKKNIIGKTNYAIFPFNKFGNLN